ncbi:MAG: DUF3795 domain-containing protein [Candidatus Hodarchaeota archaeon]
MARLIGYCGNRCYLCPARSKDPVVRQKLVDGWKRIYGFDAYTVDNVQCDGCVSAGDNGRLANNGCSIRSCARKRGIGTCAFCDNFACNKIRERITSHEGIILDNWQKIKQGEVSEEDYKLCMRQFEGMGVLFELLDCSGQLPSWWQRNSEFSSE